MCFLYMKSCRWYLESKDNSKQLLFYYKCKIKNIQPLQTPRNVGHLEHIGSKLYVL